jgi:oligopeptide transport system ATP-binding protein
MIQENKSPLLEVRGLKKQYPITAGLIFDRVIGWVKALDGVDIQIQPGQILGLVGESGSGKTTLSKLFLLLEQPTEGKLLFEGKNVHAFNRVELLRYRRSIQAVFQDPYSSLSPRCKIQKIISEPLEAGAEKINKSEMLDTVAELLHTVGLDPGLMVRFPHELSGGQRQRIAIARAVSTHSKFIILDEPTSALDVSVRLQIIHLLLELQQRMGHSYLLIGHDLAMVAYMSTEIAVMYLGKIVELAAPKELVSNTLHPYTQALIAAALPAHPRKQRERMVITGEIASSINIPPGCRFHPRCPTKKAICSQKDPPLNKVGDHHWVACHV